MTWHFICVGMLREYFKKLIDMQLITSKSLIRFLGIMLIGFGITIESNAQSYFESYSNYSGSNFSIVGGLGSTALVADLAEHDVSKQLNNFQAHIGLNYRLTNYISLRGEGGISRFYLERPGNHSITGGHINLSTVSFHSQLLVVHDIISRTSIDRGQKAWNIYFLGGVGTILFTPKDADTGENLRDVSPYANYAKIANIFPIGSGIEFFPASYLGIGFEWQYVTTSTDLLDDVRPVPPFTETDTPTAKDAYFTFGLKVSYQIGGSNNGGSVSGFNYSSYLKKSRKRAKYK